MACSTTTLIAPDADSEALEGAGGDGGASGGKSMDRCSDNEAPLTSTEAFDQVLCAMRRDFGLDREQVEVMNWSQEGDLNTEGKDRFWFFFLREVGSLENAFLAGVPVGENGASPLNGTEELERLGLTPSDCPAISVLDSEALVNAVARHPWGVTNFEERELLLGHGCGVFREPGPILLMRRFGGPGCEEVVEFSPQGEVVGICERGRCFGTGLDRGDCCCEPQP
ncbi:MAG: hypothetical protein AAGA56_18930 [Myxococcota bacterium]